ncbi:hypothetical protein ASD50_05980 [Mesorhizobium sp. Root552]|nr:hypothetical protein ASD50_05980 [Mesorhizobium sp. Root552]
MCNFLRASSFIDIHLRERKFWVEISSAKVAPKVDQADVQFSVDLFEDTLTNRSFLAMHRVYAQRQTGKAVGLVKECRRELKCRRYPINVFGRWTIRQQPILDT